MKLDDARAYALTLPETTEEPHFDRTSFRVRGKIFATAMPDGLDLNLMFGELEAQAIAESQPKWCKTLPWGKRIAGVQVRLDKADPARVRELLLDAWRGKAPKRLAEGQSSSSSPSTHASGKGTRPRALKNRS